MVKQQLEISLNQIKENTLLISCEDFDYCSLFTDRLFKLTCNAKGNFYESRLLFLDALQLLTENFNVKIIMYVRRQDSFLEALYSEYVKSYHFFDSPFLEFLNTYSLERLNWYTLVSDYVHYFGKKHVEVKLFEQNQLKNNDIVADFLSYFNVDSFQSLENKGSLNIRLAASEFEKIRSFNRLSKSFKLTNNQEKEAAIMRHHEKN